MAEKKKNLGGRPPKYKTVKEFQAKIEEYFAICDTQTKDIIDKEGNLITVPCPEPYLKSGIALHLGLELQTLRDYAKNPNHKFSCIVKNAYSRVQNDLEKRAILNPSSAVGCIFNLKCNHGMIEAAKLEVTGNEGGPIKIDRVNVRFRTKDEIASGGQYGDK